MILGMLMVDRGCFTLISKAAFLAALFPRVDGTTACAQECSRSTM
jgi:hypothetical protein